MARTDSAPAGSLRAASHQAALRRHSDQTGFVLHMYPYSESSLIIESFTRDHGRVPLLAKGAKRPRSALRGVLMQFQRVGLSWTGKGDLRNLTGAEWLGGVPTLGHPALFCGFYLNELVLKLLQRDDPHERLFDCYESALMQLGSGARGADVLRVFEKELLREIGYAIDLTIDAVTGEPVEPKGRYAYLPEQGLRRLQDGEKAERELGGADALAIARDDFSDPQTANLAKQLMRTLIERQLNGRRIATRQIFSALQQT